MSEVYRDQKIDYTGFLRNKPLEQDAGKRADMRESAFKALRAKGVQAERIRMRCYADGRVSVHVDEKFYGVFDTIKGEFFSGSPGG